MKDKIKIDFSDKKIEKIFKKMEFNYSENYNHKLVCEFKKIFEED